MSRTLYDLIRRWFMRSRVRPKVRGGHVTAPDEVGVLMRKHYVTPIAESAIESEAWRRMSNRVLEEDVYGSLFIDDLPSRHKIFDSVIDWKPVGRVVGERQRCAERRALNRRTPYIDREAL